MQFDFYAILATLILLASWCRSLSYCGNGGKLQPESAAHLAVVAFPIGSWLVSLQASLLMIAVVRRQVVSYVMQNALA